MAHLGQVRSEAVFGGSFLTVSKLPHFRETVVVVRLVHRLVIHSSQQNPPFFLSMNLISDLFITKIPTQIFHTPSPPLHPKRNNTTKMSANLSVNDNLPPRHVLKVTDLTKPEVEDIMRLAKAMKKDRDRYNEALKGDTLLMLFEKPSLRTRVSLETGMHQMGGHGIFYSIDNSPLGKKESISDTGKVLSRMVQGITGRVMSRETTNGLAAVSSIPVVNALDDFAHPLQMLADMLTIQETFGDNWEGKTMAYFGDLENNMTYDLMRLCALMGMNFRMAGDGEIEPAVWEEVNTLKSVTGVEVVQMETAAEAIKGVDIVYCDSWMSYGVPPEIEAARIKTFMPFQVTAELMKLASPEAIFMNCLPAARGMEQTAEVIDGPQSIVFDQAENRLHAQKALLVFLLRPRSFALMLTRL